jgi:hypothetical protein
MYSRMPDFGCQELRAAREADFFLGENPTVLLNDEALGTKWSDDDIDAMARFHESAFV